MICKEAKYTAQKINDFAGNPFIEALPPVPDVKELIRQLSSRPSYDPAERNYPMPDRLGLTSNLLRIHQPTENDVQVAYAIGNLLRWSYAERNPLFPEYVSTINRLYHAEKEKGSSLQCESRFHPNQHGFSLIGVSGIGKTTTVEGILCHIPQLIVHTMYQDAILNCRQVSWIKADCPGDGSMKGLCVNFFDAMDKVLGTSYSDQYKRCTLDRMLSGMARISFRENLGILVIDEIQHLCNAGSQASERVLNFIVNLVNTCAVPVIFIGTPKALGLFQRDFQQARRASAQGDVTWGCLDYGKEWDRFIKAIWPYQYTQETVNLTPALSKAFYNESFGNQCLTTVLYKLVQEDAILRSKEKFTAKDVSEVARKRLSITAPMREAFKNKQDVDIKRFFDLDSWDKLKSTIIKEERQKKAAEFGDADNSKSAGKQKMIDDAIGILVEMGIPFMEADKNVRSVYKEQKGPANKGLLARKAYDLWMLSQKERTDKAVEVPPSSGTTGYESFVNAGLIDGQEEAS